jgi:N-methylhydantoinase B
MNEGKVVGKAKYPDSTAVSTTNFCCELFNAAQAVFGKVGESYGIAEGQGGLPPNYSVLSGEDFRREDGSFVNQLVCTGGGGPASHGHDGWHTYCEPGSGVVMNRDSIEIDEQKFPILFERHELITDSEGAGKWRGAPGSLVEFSPRGNSMTVAFVLSSRDNPPQGIKGGKAGSPQEAYKITSESEREELPSICIEDIHPDESVVGSEAGGGGYGNPLERDPEQVKEDVIEGIITAKKAKNTYGVKIDSNGVNKEIDWEKTKDMREDVGD